MFPVDVSSPAGEFSQASILVADGRVRVWVAVNREPHLVIDDATVEGEAVTRARKRGEVHLVALASGATLEFKRGRGCGCGHVLKSFNGQAWLERQVT